jgi:SAM-dependent methyltransferase
MICNLCHASEFREVWALRSRLLESPVEILRKPGAFHIDACTSCGLMQVREIPSLDDDYLAAFYGKGFYESYNLFGTMSYAKYLNKRPFVRLARVLDESHGPGGSKKLLEIGCAYGGFLKECTALGWDAEGVDISKHAIEVAAKDGLKVHCGDFRKAGLAPQAYDAVVCLATLEHVRDPQQFLIDAAGFLRPGGLLMFTTIDMAGLMPRLMGRRWAQVCPPEHLYYFRQSHLARYLQNAGLTPLRVGGKVIPGTRLYRVRDYRPGRQLWNVGYVLFVARKGG